MKRSGFKSRPPRRKPSRKPVSPASPEQRAKVKGMRCAYCRIEASEYWAIDPAHLCARGRGGCDDEDCVIPLCRGESGAGCHRDFDAGLIDLAPKLEPYFRREVAHAVMHLGLFGAVRRITGDRNYGERAA